jgi:uncharacterized membrane protein
MGVQAVRARDKDSWTQFLGWFSVGLGTAQVSAPGTMCGLVGASREGRSRGVMRLIGVRELAQGLGILMRPRPTYWLWSRVTGDAIDLSLLALTALRNKEHRGRTLFAIANVVAVTAPDIAESVHLSRRHGKPRGAMLVRKAVTINRPQADVERAWGQAAELSRKIDDAGAFVSFENAPGDRGTELAVEFLYAPVAGDLGAAAQKLLGQDLPTELADELRRFKQLVETGEIVRSEATPEGHLLARHVRQRPARPLEEAVR